MVIKINKKSQSLMVSYVILISIVIALSIGVFAWLKLAANVGPAVSCKEGTSISLVDFICTTDGINIDLKNNGRFNIEGIILTMSNESGLTNPLYLLPSNLGNQGQNPGSYFFDTLLKPKETITLDYSDRYSEFTGITGKRVEFSDAKEFNSETLTTIQIQPFILDENGIIVCQDALIKQEIEGCQIG